MFRVRTRPLLNFSHVRIPVLGALRPQNIAGCVSVVIKHGLYTTYKEGLTRLCLWTAVRGRLRGIIGATRQDGGTITIARFAQTISRMRTWFGPCQGKLLCLMFVRSLYSPSWRSCHGTRNTRHPTGLIPHSLQLLLRTNKAHCCQAREGLVSTCILGYKSRQSATHSTA
ncbi:hypothetical protein VUR80DRAFT_3347 [Thermomyces stellatus]